MDDVLVASLYELCDGPSLTVADGDAVERTDGHDLRRRACEEELVGDVQRLSRDGLDPHVDSRLPCELQRTRASEPLEVGAVDGRREHLAIAHDEEVLARALAHHARRVERHGLDVSVGLCLHLDQLSVVVVARRLGHARERVGRRTAPRRSAAVNPARKRFRAQVRTPFPRGDKCLDRRASAVHADRTVAAKHHGSDVAAFMQPIGLDDLEAGSGNIVRRVGHIDAVHLARV
mmetsp:Transcript_13194/g.33811  ORF Transcript_13194/g.33811 Transcript_13194/m.33811 type:complete len:233 (-) Transcript_13194:205-903(-)